MTAQLVKFEFRSSFRLLLVVWAALTAMTVILCALISVSGMGFYKSFTQSSQLYDIISSIVHAVSWIAYVALFAAVVVLTVAIVIARFYRGLLGEEGYLMHTLPVREWQLITAKGVTATCAVIGSILVGILSIVLIVNTGSFANIIEFFRDLGQGIAKEPLTLVIGIEFLILSVLGIVKSIYQIYASIAIGQLSSRHRILSSLGAYIGITVALSILAGIIFFVATVSGATDSISKWFEMHTAIVDDNGMQGFGPSQIVMLAIFLGEAIQLVIFHIVCERILTKRLNLV